MQLAIAETVSEATGGRNITAAVVTGLTVRLWPRKMWPLLWDQTRADVVAPDASAAVEAYFAGSGGNGNNHDAVRYKLAAVQHQGAAKGLSVVTLYAPANNKGSHSNPVYIFVIVAEERQALRWVGAPRKLCHSATHELIYNEATRALLLGFRSCHVSKFKQTKLPTPEEVSDLIFSAGGPRRTFTHQELPAGFL